MYVYFPDKASRVVVKAIVGSVKAALADVVQATESYGCMEELRVGDGKAEDLRRIHEVVSARLMKIKLAVDELQAALTAIGDVAKELDRLHAQKVTPPVPVPEHAVVAALKAPSVGDVF